MGDAKKPHLPLGWKVHTSKTYPDRIYYFNEITGVSSWECPELIVTHGAGLLTKSLQKKPIPANSNNSQANKSVKRKAEPVKKESQDNRNSNQIFKQNTNAVQETVILTKDSAKLNARTAVVAPVCQKVPLPNEMKKNPGKDQADFQSTRYVSMSPPRKKIVLKRSNSNSDSNVKTEPNKRFKAISPLESPSGRFTGSKFVQISNPVRENKQQIQRSSTYTSASKRTSISYNTLSAASGCSPSQVNSENQPVCSDVEMFDISSVDLALLETEPMVVDDPNSYFIIVDTNVLISNLKFIDELKDTPFEGSGPPHIYIPWIVVTELDGLKKNSKNGISRNAMEATRYLCNKIKLKHPRFHGQSAEEAQNCPITYKECNDNRILQCCLNLATIVPINKVILLTNDENLRLKCAIHEVVVHDTKSIMKALKADVIIQELTPNKGNEDNFAISRKASVTGPGIGAVDNIICEAKCLLKSFLEPFYVKEMTIAYKQTWKHFQNAIQPPYVLLEILESINRYWKTVFGLVLPNNQISLFKCLQEKFKLTKGFLSSEEEALSILESIECIALSVQIRSPDLKVPVSQLRALKDECTELCRKHTIIDNNICTTVTPTVLPVFEFIWSLTNRLCGQVMDFYNIPHSFTYNKPEEQPSKEQFDLLLSNLYPSVHLIKRHMSSIFGAQNDVVFQHFHSSLLEFVPSLKIPVQLPPSTDFTKDALKVFCKSAQSKDLLQNGYKQLCQFQSKLSDALEVMMKCKKKC